jgi:hypothetical protein
MGLTGSITRVSDDPLVVRCRVRPVPSGCHHGLVGVDCWGHAGTWFGWVRDVRGWDVTGRDHRSKNGDTEVTGMGERTKLWLGLLAFGAGVVLLFCINAYGMGL